MITISTITTSILPAGSTDVAVIGVQNLIHANSIFTQIAADDTHVYFLDEVVRRGDAANKDIFAPQTMLMPSSVGITSEIQRNPHAIGYDGLGYVTDHEKVIAVAKDAAGPFVVPSVQTGADGSYPIARGLYMYTAGEPAGEIADFITWITGPQGQQIVADLGFVPLTQE